MELGVVDESNEKVNRDNEWAQRMKEFMLGGAVPKGRPALRGKKLWPKSPHKSTKQLAALRR